jgi:hypothetical protein
MHVVLALSALSFALVMGGPAALAQDQPAGGGGKTFKADLYFSPRVDAAGGLKVEKMQSPVDLGVWVQGTPQKLQSVSVTPGQDAEVVKYKDLTFRITGLYRGPQKDRMFLRVSFDQGGQAAVKEFLAGLDESVVVTYPMRNGASGTIVVVLVPSG